MDTTFSKTEFNFPGQKKLYHGKVRDVYTINDDLLVMIATDRISAFDVILPKPVPYKGQVLNQIAAHFLEATKDIVPNWLRAIPDPNVSVGVKAKPVKLEMVIRGCLVGHSWRVYQTGKRELCGQPMPNNMSEYDSFPEPIITPSSKAEFGHDEDVTEEFILSNKLVTRDEWERLTTYTKALFRRGQEMARNRGLILADTKYEFGIYEDKIILIDEIHTPDSSRYFYADTYDKYVAGNKDEEPKQLSKEFVREWLMDHGFSGQDGQKIPELTPDFIDAVSNRYIELYEAVTGMKFAKALADDVLERIETNTRSYLENL